MAGFQSRYFALSDILVAPLAEDLSANLAHAPLRDGLKFAISPHPEGSVATRQLRSFTDCAKAIIAMGDSAYQLPSLWPADGDEFAAALRTVLERHRPLILAAYGELLSLHAPVLPANEVNDPVGHQQQPGWIPPPPPMRPPGPQQVAPAAAPDFFNHLLPDPRIDRLSSDLAQVVDHIRRSAASPGSSGSAGSDLGLQQQLRALQNAMTSQQADFQRAFTALAQSSGRPASAAVDWGARVFASSTAWRDPAEWFKAFAAGDLGPLLAMLRDAVFATRGNDGLAAHAGFSAAMELMVFSYQATAGMPGSPDQRFQAWWPALRSVLASALCVHEHAASEAGGKSTGPRFAAVLRPLLVKLDPDAWTEEAIRKAVSIARAQGGTPIRSTGTRQYGRAPSRGRRGMGPSSSWDDRSVGSRPSRRIPSPARSASSRRPSSPGQSSPPTRRR